MGHSPSQTIHPLGRGTFRRGLDAFAVLDSAPRWLKPPTVKILATSLTTWPLCSLYVYVQVTQFQRAAATGSALKLRCHHKVNRTTSGRRDRKWPSSVEYFRFQGDAIVTSRMIFPVLGEGV